MCGENEPENSGRIDRRKEDWTERDSRGSFLADQEWGHKDDGRSGKKRFGLVFYAITDVLICVTIKECQTIRN